MKIKNTEYTSADKPAEEEPRLFIVGQGFNFEGTIKGGGICIVEGVAQGDIEVDDVKINSLAFVSGAIKCNRLDLAGRIEGSVVVREVVVRSGGILQGNLSYSSISIESGGVVDGELSNQESQSAIETPDLLTIKLPVEIITSLEDANEFHIEMEGGALLPAWISLEGGNLILDKFQYEQFIFKNRHLILKILIDGDSYHVRLP
ncbi:polymer-forming cytoskeletal protein [Polynucleobacter sp. Ross1-W9]|uniref:bactofilin family protein n=1 Tax=Polynucleobacter parvulilacunae TaxID=1855631 RepID=UPI001C0AD5E2|nr:polymer-forming cytoskeletal protein [Polynucleobacter parvulilacunae]MBU3557444.1 polymer-forming cytoskeletal protein [Polynucleobacter parvulilacunae]